MACTIPVAISASLDTVLRKCGNVTLLERRGDVDPADICKQKCNKCGQNDYELVS